MSDELKQPRKPRFYRAEEPVPAARTEPAPAEQARAEQNAAQEPGPAAAAHPAEPAVSSRDSSFAGAEPLPREAVLHKPREKTARQPQSEATPDLDEAAPETGDQAVGRTLPTLNDIKRGFRWSAIFMSAAGALAAMAFVSWLHSFIADLVTREDWIGWLAVGLTAIALTAIAMIILRELIALLRLRRLGHLRDQAARALTHDDRASSERIQSEVSGLFADRRSLAWGLAGLKEQQKEVLSARDRLVLVERNLMLPLDKDARRIVADSAKRTSVMTAISPFAFLDMILVAMENMRMLHRLMTLYGGRPGVLSQFKLVQLMIANLALTGGIAVGADLLGHIMGRQVATRLAGRLGEGVINGSLTARLGITATKLIRPLPYIEAKPMSVSAFIKELTQGSKQERSS